MLVDIVQFICMKLIRVAGVAKKEYMPAFSSEHVGELKCDFDTQAMKDIKFATANFYPSTTSFAKFQGVDLLPERKHEYLRTPAGLPSRFFLDNLNFDDARYITPEIMVKSCSVPSAEKGWTWNIQRFGPFESHGNYDWWQLGGA